MIAANGLNFHVRDEGTGSPVLLLHGFPDTGDLWQSQVAALTGAGYRTIAPDLRGRGLSDKPEGVAQYALPLLVQDVACILDQMGVRRAHVVCHDWGAAVGWLLAALMPDRVERLVAISVGFPGAAGLPDLESLQKSWYRILFQFEGVAEDLYQRRDWYLAREMLQGGGDVEAAIRELSRPGALTPALNWYRANLPVGNLISEGPGPQLPHVQAPTLGIWSSGDLYLTERSMTASEQMVDGPWRYERIEGASHWIPIDAAERLNQLLLEFLTPFA